MVLFEGKNQVYCKVCFDLPRIEILHFGSYDAKNIQIEGRMGKNIYYIRGGEYFCQLKNKMSK